MEDNNKDKIDELKMLWHSQKDYINYDSEKIFSMIHRKSINSVQWLFIISLIELLIGLFITLWSLFSGKHYYSSSVMEVMGEENISRIETFSNTGIVFSFVLMGIIYYFYRKISTQSSINTLINSIIRFRKAVVICLIAIVLILLIFMFPIYFEIGKNIAIQNSISNSATSNLSPEELQKVGRTAGWFMAVISVSIIGLFFFGYYYLIYGFFLRRLTKNQRELKEIRD